jgi:hypothetical protein
VIYSGDGSYGYKKTLRKFTKDGEQIWSEALVPTWGRAYMWNADLMYNPNDGYVYVVGAVESNFKAPNDADNNHTGMYDAIIS